MKKYLATLHEKPDHHKKRFAFLASGIVTLLIFSMWSLANFGEGGTLVSDDKQMASAHEASPLSSLNDSLSSGFEGLFRAFGEIKATLSDTIDLAPDAELQTSGSLNTYGR